jgi:Family of unknown function (DUF6644)
MLVSLLERLQETGFFSYIRGSAYAYPVLLWLHIVAIIALGGMVIVTDLRLLGLGLRSYSVPGVVNGLRVPKRVCFILALVCGALMFGAKAAQYSYNPWFWIKLTLLALIAANYLIFRRSVYDGAANVDRAPQLSGKGKLAAALSLFLWTGVVWAGRGPATIKDIMHSMVDPSGDFLFRSVQLIADEHGVREKAPRTDEEWDNVRQRVRVLLEAPDLLSTPDLRAARPRDRSKNPQVESEPAEVQRLLDAGRPDFNRRARRLQDAATVAMKAVDAKDKDALLRALEGIDKACESCHLRYWYPNDKRAQQAAKADGIIE